MEIASSPIQSYQHNQNIGDSARNDEAQSLVGANPEAEAENPDDGVFISDQRKVYQWVASEFPQVTSNPATVSRASQMLYEYQLLDFNDINTINAVVANSDSAEEPITSVLNEALLGSESYAEKKSLAHLKQVFSTLEAAVTY
ncbi:hypothetical protein [Reinekea marinisedimentorum]|uniref:Uncharacterized protein n=1 Tax=Reinekea marinisedimentorum TaxID=230495 RepID=A0A4V2UJX2_9GAMM|nr:hypothetical protein [Reinekea marinisedimentorum]TCS41668.1 hypothetical protein BCF53_10595 [Reinekea marinisedimentorum]